MFVADEFGIIVGEVAAIGSREIVFGIDFLDISRFVKVLIGPKTLVNNDLLAEFCLGNPMDGVSAWFVFEYRPTRHEPLAFDRLILTLSEEDTTVVFDHKIDRDKWDVCDDCPPFVGRDRFSVSVITRDSS